MHEYLEQLDITGKEADVYLAILKVKKTSIIELSKMTNIKRTSIYHCLEGLINKELVSVLMEDNKKYYIAQDPNIGLSNLVKEKKEAVRLALPTLTEIFGKGTDDADIKIYHSTSGLQTIFDDITKSKEKIARYYVSELNMEELLGEEFMEKFVKKRVKAGVRSLSLRSFKYKPKREENITHAKQLREVRFVPDDIIIKPFLCVYDDKVVMLSTKASKTGFVLESKEFAQSQKAIFDLIWNKIAI